MSAPVVAPSDRVVAVLRELGGQASRRTVLDAVAATVPGGYRDAIGAVALAEMFGRIERVPIGPDGRPALKLTPQEAQR